MNDLFVYNERLGISIPTLLKEWNEYEKQYTTKNPFTVGSYSRQLSPIE